MGVQAVLKNSYIFADFELKENVIQIGSVLAMQNHKH